jgi:hypothetical protein
LAALGLLSNFSRVSLGGESAASDGVGGVPEIKGKQE